MRELKLEPCPFCGGGAHVFPSNYADVTLWNARCTKCYAAHDGHKKPKDAVAKWNTRAPHPAHAAVEAMAQALEDIASLMESTPQVGYVEGKWWSARSEALASSRTALAAYRATQNKDVRP